MTPEKRHLKRVVGLGCIICGASAVPHHIRDISAGTGMGYKASDFETIPLCNPHHTSGGYGMAYHAGPEIWEANFGTQQELLAQVRDELGLA